MTTKINLNGVHELDLTLPGTMTAAISAGVVTLSNTTSGSVGITVDGSGSTPGTGTKGYIKLPFNCTITGWTILADQSGSAVFDVKYASSVSGIGSTTSITGTAKPTLTAAQAVDSTTLTGWTTAFIAGNLLEFDLVSVASATRITLELTLQKT